MPHHSIKQVVWCVQRFHEASSKNMNMPHPRTTHHLLRMRRFCRLLHEHPQPNLFRPLPVEKNKRQEISMQVWTRSVELLINCFPGQQDHLYFFWRWPPNKNSLMWFWKKTCRFGGGHDSFLIRLPRLWFPHGCEWILAGSYSWGQLLGFVKPSCESGWHNFGGSRFQLTPGW